MYHFIVIFSTMLRSEHLRVYIFNSSKSLMKISARSISMNKLVKKEKNMHEMEIGVEMPLVRLP
jgi:hypothetical protein